MKHIAPFLIGIDVQGFYKGSSTTIITVAVMDTRKHPMQIVENTQHQLFDQLIPEHYEYLAKQKEELAAKYPGAVFMQER